MKAESTQKIVDILKFHGSMIGVDEKETRQLIKELRQVEQLIGTDMDTKRIFTRQDEADKIISDVCKVAEIEVDELKSAKRNQEFVVARQLACYLLREKFKEEVTLLRIGKMIGLNHSTVIYSHKRVAQQIEMNDKLVMDLMNKLDTDYLKKAA